MFTTISSPSLLPPDRSGTHWITFSTFTVFILATFKFLFPLCQKNVKLTSVKINSVKRHREQKRNENRSIFRLWHPHQQHSPVSKHMRWKRIIRVKRKFFVEKYSCGYIESCWLFLVCRHRSFLSIVKILIIFSCDELRRQERGEKTFFSLFGDSVTACLLRGCLLFLVAEAKGTRSTLCTKLLLIFIEKYFFFLLPFRIEKVSVDESRSLDVFIIKRDLDGARNKVGVDWQCRDIFK